MWKFNILILISLALVSSAVTEDQLTYSNEPCNSENEQFLECANGHCGNQLCSRKTLPVACPSISECVKGCLCKHQYLRDVNGTCVPEDQCSIGPQCLENEEYTTCEEKICRPTYCGEMASPSCKPEEVKDEDCTANCVCKENYARGRTGFCVPISEC